MDYEIESKVKYIEPNHDDKIDPELNKLIDEVKFKKPRQMAKPRMTLQWKFVMSTSTPEKMIRAYVFGPIVRIEEIENAKYINAHNFFIFKNCRYQTESELIKAVDKASSIDNKHKLVDN
jgi:hypothetical protein